MEISERMNLVAPCGIDCGICELYICKDSTALFERLVANGIPKEKIPCKDCRAIEGNCPLLNETCATYSCLQEKKIDFCFDCGDFPCVMLQPSSDRADVLPHNLKVFNLSKIKNAGLQQFIENSLEIKKRYYKGKMIIGKGPQI